MSIQQRKVFRIEKYVSQSSAPSMVEAFEDDTFEEMTAPAPAPAPAPVPVAAAPAPSDITDYPWAEQHREIMDTLAKMNEEIVALKTAAPVAVEAVAAPVDVEGDEKIAPLTAEEIEDARKLRAELKDIYDAIEQTKVEILTIHQSGVNGMEISRVTDELGAIVGGTEKATETILEAAESIDQAAADLVATLTDETTHGMASDIQDGVVKIFESCNFQDLTGQRISKVISAFRFIEERVIQMMEIWGGVDSFKEVETEDREDRQGDRALLNGPALEEDDNVASQDDIDALFD
ncbi:MAG: protein phosphatase CheZ [Methyloligellaceae bacterium]